MGSWLGKLARVRSRVAVALGRMDRLAPYYHGKTSWARWLLLYVHGGRIGNTEAGTDMGP
jgi:hypothetical protein